MGATLMTSSAARSAGAAGTKTEDRAGKYLTFHLGGEEFGIRVTQVREIIGVQDITSVPQTPDYVEGVINLRGKVTPIICLRKKFGMAQVEHTQRTCIIVVQIKGEAGPLTLGVLVDGVSEVAALAAADIENRPDFGTSVDLSYILGMAKTKGRVRILLDIDAALNSHDLQGLEGLTKSF
jgi:purine-binding chemotaxis protein CheW